ncbi:MAG TPA: hypothetical protein VNO43_19340, partial [Candidatus Eisenbacteria bacterium]|nr:hypothetical protein [Candidatus Eisenbacteria bacterium]
MRIENLRLEERGARTRSVATVVWEDCARPPQDVYFETESVFAEGLWPNPDAFLTVCLMPALWHGETRVRVDGRICPELRSGLLTVMGVMRSWNGITRPPVRIEAEPRPPAFSDRAARAGFFFSAGVDSLATLRLNHLNFSADHPGYFKDGLLVYGMEVDRPDAFEHVLKTASVIAEAAAITMIPVYTNARSLEEEWDFWIDLGQGAVFAAAAHSLSRRLTTVSIASSYDVPHLHHTSTHPLIDPNYSSWDLRIKHDAVEMPRVDKIRLLADWDVAIDNVRVCNQAHLYNAERLNCGKCEKCVRTMIGFLIA